MTLEFLTEETDLFGNRKFRTGDIAYFETILTSQLLTEMIGIRSSGHAGILFVGPEFDHMAIDGIISPSHTYYCRCGCILVPLEEEMLLWWEFNCCFGSILQRQGGPDIEPELAISTFFQTLKRHNNQTNLQNGNVLLSWFGIDDSTGWFPTFSCSQDVGYFLSQVGILDPRISINLILPDNLRECCFGSVDPYELIPLFNRKRIGQFWNRMRKKKYVFDPPYIQTIRQRYPEKRIGKKTAVDFNIYQYRLYQKYGK